MSPAAKELRRVDRGDPLLDGGLWLSAPEQDNPARSALGHPFGEGQAEASRATGDDELAVGEGRVACVDVRYGRVLQAPGEDLLAAHPSRADAVAQERADQRTVRDVLSTVDDVDRQVFLTDDDGERGGRRPERVDVLRRPILRPGGPDQDVHSAAHLDAVSQHLLGQ